MSPSEFTPAEQRVLIYLRQGCSNEGIATALGISVNTVKTHLRHMYRKCNVHSRTELIVKVLSPHFS